jgi:hypothetical protein
MNTTSWNRGPALSSVPTNNPTTLQQTASASPSRQARLLSRKATCYQDPRAFMATHPPPSELHWGKALHSILEGGVLFRAAPSDDMGFVERPRYLTQGPPSHFPPCWVGLPPPASVPPGKWDPRVSQCGMDNKMSLRHRAGPIQLPCGKPSARPGFPRPLFTPMALGGMSCPQVQPDTVALEVQVLARCQEVHPSNCGSTLYVLCKAKAFCPCSK